MNSKTFNISPGIATFYLFVTCVLVFISSYTFFQNKKMKSAQTEYYEMLIKYQESEAHLLDAILVREYLQIKAEATELNLTLSLYSLNGDTILLKDFEGLYDKLFFRIFENSCPPCVEIELTHIERYVNELGTSSVNILASYDNIRHLKLFIEPSNSYGL